MHSDCFLRTVVKFASGRMKNDGGCRAGPVKHVITTAYLADILLLHVFRAHYTDVAAGYCTGRSGGEVL